MQRRLEGILMPVDFTAYEGNEPFVFISYAHKDTDIVLPVIRGLHQRGLRVWYDGGIPLTEEWLDVIAEHLAKSDCVCVLPFVSRNFEDSANCRQEISYAMDRKKGIAVIYLEPRENLKPRTQMQLINLHALFYDKYPTVNELLDALVMDPVLRQYITTAMEPVPIESQPVAFDTIDFADEADTLPAEKTPEECYDMADRLYREEKYEEAVAWYRKAAEQGHALAQKELGRCCEHGVGTEANLEEALAWYRKAKEGGQSVDRDILRVEKMLIEPALDPEECCNLANRLYNEEKYEEAMEWYRKAAQQGHAKAQYQLGRCYFVGRGVPARWKEAVKWYRMAADQGHIYAQSSLGYCYERGYGVVADLQEALYWYRKAKQNGHTLVDNDIARCEKKLKKPWWKK